ncbi:DUF3300 domain-containing protein [Rivibacter subsaxonicus]|nr:DUF3300 domain-containing protein [Rivibacter subsaxonicus]
MLLGGALSAAHAQDATFKDEELDQMLAPIALYPDSLLAQVLMATTYPADVKAAAAWSKAHPDAKGDAAVKQVENQPWEPAVQSLVAFPQVLAMMNDKPDDVQRLGDAFLADPSRVMDRVQVLRKKAEQAGNLKSNEQQKVSTQTAESKQVIVIEPAQPQSVYVPVYQPTVYGTWAYPSYPPYYWPPPAYYYPGAAFVGGVIWGAAVVGIANGLWGGCNWGGGDVNINVNKYNNINSNRQINANNTKFEHNADRRGDVPYRDNKSREQYGKKQLDGAKDREAYRGKDGRDAERDRAANTLAERGADPAAGREKLQGADRDKATAAVRDSDRGGAGGGAGDRAGAGQNRPSNAAAGGAADRGATNRASSGSGGARDNALAGAHSGGAARASADRGQASRQSMSQHSGAGRAAGGARAGGGGGGRRR